MINFTPMLDSTTKDLLKNKEILSDIGNMVGFPYSIILPSAIKDNISDFKNVFNKHQINHKIFFAHKCNQSSAVIKECLHNDINIDVSSERELMHTLQNGYRGENILATGPKNKEFIWLALQHKVTISIDSLNELQTVLHFCNKLNTLANILIRINGADSNMVKKYSRFGLDDKELLSALKLLQSNPQINLLGLALHFDTINLKEKVNGIKKRFKLMSRFFIFNKYERFFVDY